MALGRGYGRLVRIQPEEMAVFFRKRFWAPAPIANHVERLADGKHFSGILIHDFITESNGAALRLDEARPNHENVIEPRRTLETAMRIGDDDVAVIFQLHFLVIEAEPAAPLDAADFKPSEKIRVINHSHLIGFSIPNADGSLRKFVY